MRGQAMKEVLERLGKKKLDISKMHALEIFAREGDWHSIVYADKVKTLDAWEINKKFKKKLKRNLPKANIKITDSIKEIRKKINFSRYHFIVVDNPQNIFGSRNQYCEHFDTIPKICRLINAQGILIFNINKEPFNYDKYPDWQKRRKLFYRRKNTNKLSINWLKNFYKKLFSDFGYRTRFCFNVSRNDLEHNDYLHYLIFYLSRRR